MPTHTSTSMSWSRTFSRSTRRVSGCLQSTQPPCRPHCQHQRPLVPAQSKAATRLWSLVRRPLSSGLSTRAVDLSELKPWTTVVMLLLVPWVLLVLPIWSMLPRRPLSQRSGLLRSDRRRRLDHTMVQPMVSSPLVQSVALLAAPSLRSVVSVETLP